MSSLKIAVNQIHQLPENVVNKYINGVIYPMRRASLLEARKDIPNLDIIQTCKGLERSVLEAYDTHKVHTLSSTALFVFKADEKAYKTEDEKRLAQRNDARETLMRRVADKAVRPPKSAAELEALIDVEIRRAADNIAEQFGIATDAVQLIETLSDDDGEYDEDCLPEWVTDSIIGKLTDAGTQAYKDSVRGLERAKYEFQKQAPRAAREGALKLLAFFGVTEDEVSGYLETSTKATEELFQRLEHEALPTINDEQPTPKEKKKMYRVQKAALDGITSADMAMASGK